jgi:hypothetical protein
VPGGNVPQRQPQSDLGSDVPDGFEFLNETTPEQLPTDVHTRSASRTLLLLCAGLVAAGIIAALTFTVLRAQPDAETTAPRPPATADAPEPGTSSVPTPPSAPTSPPPTPTTSPELPDSAALQVLAHLDVKGRAPATGYERERFGPDWADVDGNGCDTRNDILARDLTQIVTDPGDACEVEIGRLLDPYSNGEIDFTRGWETSFAVQIDHVVALSNAWQTGAQYWKPRKRLKFANDPLNLLAVDGALNMQKSDGDAATWLPPSKPFRCSYVARQIAAKEKYGLWITAPERDAMARILATCPSQGLPS